MSVETQAGDCEHVSGMLIDRDPAPLRAVVNVTPCQSSLLSKKLRLDDRAEGRLGPGDAGGEGLGVTPRHLQGGSRRQT